MPISNDTAPLAQFLAGQAVRAQEFLGSHPFGVFFSILFANERPTPLMFVGFALIFIAVVCSETKFSFLRKKKS